ncbi:hypothetical protein [Aquimarina latercula]|uniref:hypothetical protein n=1 Tax=Aquimarina latercula TaxID=987 RepID=UPI00041D94F6|nr:hypothetical protein [Aquimarina latercula]
MALDILYHYFLFKWFKYIRFSGYSDEEHLVKSFNILRSKYSSKEGFLNKERNIFGIKSKAICVKSTGYFIKLNNTIKKEIRNPDNLVLELKVPSEIINQNELFNFCQLYFCIEDTEPTSKKIKEIIYRCSEKIHIDSTHIKLLKLRFDYLTGIIDNKHLESEVVRYISNKKISEIMMSNSFSNKKESTSHELGYLLNITFDIYEDTKSEKILKCLESYIEKLHRIFVGHKTIYSIVIKKGDRISLSGSFLIAKLFFRYTILSKDFRYANAGFFILDLGKLVQKLNRKNLISNSFPVYKYGSPFKYPVWTLCYFIECLQLKIKVKDLLKNEVSLYI